MCSHSHATVTAHTHTHAITHVQGALGEDVKAGDGGLMMNQQNVASYTAEPPISTFEFAGMDYHAIRQQVGARQW